MAGSKYYDTAAAMQVIGCVLNNPSLLDDTGQYTFREEDFNNDFHKVVFGAVYNLKFMGAEHLNAKAVEDYLENKEKSYGIYKANKGSEWMHQVFVEADVSNFDYYYGKLKKMTLLRTYDEIGFNVSWIYDPDNILDIKKKEEQNKKLDELSVADLADMIDNRVLRVREMVVDNDVDESCQLGDSIYELIDGLQKNPVIGAPLFDSVLDKVALGARPGCFYLRSASTGTGKSRSAMADACYLACNKMYDIDVGDWIDIGAQQPVVFISVELDKDELQTMALSFVSGLSEHEILQGQFSFEDEQRLKVAADIIQNSPIYMEYLPNYSMKDIENCIKRNLRVHKTTFVFFDYLTSSMRIIEEISQASGGMKIREDQVLFLLSSKLKDIASTFKVFIFSSTQINGSYKHERILDQNMLAGAKAIANRIDFGSIMVDVNKEDLEDLEEIYKINPLMKKPNLKMSIYKNRRGKWNRIILWMRARKDVCRYETLFVTDFDLNIIEM